MDPKPDPNGKSRPDLLCLQHTTILLGFGLPLLGLDRIYCASSTQMSAIPDASIHLMVTSPSYNVKKEYDEDLSLRDYRELLRAVLADFLVWTKSIWTFPAVSAKRIGHPAPFPGELPHPLIQCYTFTPSPAMSSGTRSAGAAPPV